MFIVNVIPVTIGTDTEQSHLPVVIRAETNSTFLLNVIKFLFTHLQTCYTNCILFAHLWIKINTIRNMTFFHINSQISVLYSYPIIVTVDPKMEEIFSSYMNLYSYIVPTN